MNPANPAREAMPFARFLRLLRVAIRPTWHPPRTQGKLRVLRLRAHFRLPLHVAGDAALPERMALNTHRIASAAFGKAKTA